MFKCSTRHPVCDPPFVRSSFNPGRLPEVIAEIRQHLLEIPKSVREQIETEVEDLCHFVIGLTDANNFLAQRKALEALLYLLDPYDAVHDRHGALGKLCTGACASDS